MGSYVLFYDVLLARTIPKTCATSSFPQRFLAGGSSRSLGKRCPGRRGNRGQAIDSMSFAYNAKYQKSDRCSLVQCMWEVPCLYDHRNGCTLFENTKAHTETVQSTTKLKPRDLEPIARSDVAACTRSNDFSTESGPSTAKEDTENQAMSTKNNGTEVESRRLSPSRTCYDLQVASYCQAWRRHEMVLSTGRRCWLVTSDNQTTCDMIS